jgi:hypothetical protein
VQFSGTGIVLSIPNSRLGDYAGRLRWPWLCGLSAEHPTCVSHSLTSVEGGGHGLVAALPRHYGQKIQSCRHPAPLFTAEAHVFPARSFFFHRRKHKRLVKWQCCLASRVGRILRSARSWSSCRLVYVQHWRPVASTGEQGVQALRIPLPGPKSERGTRMPCSRSKRCGRRRERIAWPRRPPPMLRTSTQRRTPSVSSPIRKAEGDRATSIANAPIAHPTWTARC